MQEPIKAKQTIQELVTLSYEELCQQSEEALHTMLTQISKELKLLEGSFNQKPMNQRQVEDTEIPIYHSLSRQVREIKQALEEKHNAAKKSR